MEGRGGGDTERKERRNGHNFFNNNDNTNNKLFFVFVCIIANTCAIRQQVAHTIYQLSPVLAAQQEKRKEKKKVSEHNILGEFVENRLGRVDH